MRPRSRRLELGRRQARGTSDVGDAQPGLKARVAKVDRKACRPAGEHPRLRRRHDALERSCTDDATSRLSAALRGARNGVTAGGAGSDHRAVLRRPAVILAIALDIAVVIGAILALLNGFSPIVLAFAAILAMAPWAAIIDDSERPKRD